MNLRLLIVWFLPLLATVSNSVFPGLHPLTPYFFILLCFALLLNLPGVVFLSQLKLINRHPSHYDLGRIYILINLSYFFILLPQTYNLIRYFDEIPYGMIREFAFYKSDSDLPSIYNNGFEYIVFSSFRYFVLFFLLSIISFQKPVKLLLILYLYDCLIHSDRLFLLVFIYCLISYYFVFKYTIGSKKIIYASLFIVFAVVFYSVTSAIRLDPRPPHLALIENISIPTRLFAFLLNSFDDFPGFFTYGELILSNIFGPITALLNKMGLVSPDYTVNNYLDSFQCIQIFQDHECIYANAYSTGFLNQYRDFGLLGFFLYPFILFTLVYILSISNGFLFKRFIFFALTANFFLFYFTPTFTFINFFCPVYILILFNSLCKK